MKAQEDEKLTIIIHREQGWVCARVKEIPEIHVQEKTLIEVMESIVSIMKDMEDNPRRTARP